MTNNELIAIFMGGKPKSQCLPAIAARMSNDKYWLPFHGIVKVDNMDYHKSWDWLMPVVEKIETTIYSFSEDLNELTRKRNINSAEAFFFINYNHQIKKWSCFIELERTGLRFGASQEFDSKMDAVYYAVVQFIKFYNDDLH